MQLVGEHFRLPQTSGSRQFREARDAFRGEGECEELARDAGWLGGIIGNNDVAGQLPESVANVPAIWHMVI
jgi:hypothetical protein